jgi:XTP/dITP diphosphohydrolase
MDGEEYLFEGIVRGDIATEEHGEGGFGYDPLFYSNELSKTYAEASSEEKNRLTGNQ